MVMLLQLLREHSMVAYLPLPQAVPLDLLTIIHVFSQRWCNMKKASRYKYSRKTWLACSYCHFLVDVANVWPSKSVKELGLQATCLPFDTGTFLSRCGNTYISSTGRRYTTLSGIPMKMKMTKESLAWLVNMFLCFLFYLWFSITVSCFVLKRFDFLMLYCGSFKFECDQCLYDVCNVAYVVFSFYYHCRFWLRLVIRHSRANAMARSSVVHRS